MPTVVNLQQIYNNPLQSLTYHIQAFRLLFDGQASENSFRHPCFMLSKHLYCTFCLRGAICCFLCIMTPLHSATRVYIPFFLVSLNHKKTAASQFFRISTSPGLAFQKKTRRESQLGWIRGCRNHGDGLVNGLQGWYMGVILATYPTPGRTSSK